MLNKPTQLLKVDILGGTGQTKHKTVKAELKANHESSNMLQRHQDLADGSCDTNRHAIQVN